MRNVLIRRGQVEGTLYYFNTGEGLPLHNHPVEGAHVTFVMSGAISVKDGDMPLKRLAAGSVYDFPAGRPHEIFALEDNTIIWNALKGVEPP